MHPPKGEFRLMEHLDNFLGYFRHCWAGDQQRRKMFLKKTFACSFNGGEILCNENNSILIPQNLPKARSDNNSTFLKKTFAWCFWDHEI